MRATAAVAAAFVFLATLVSPSPAKGAAGSWVVNGPSRLRLISPYLKAPAASAVRLGLEFRTEPGWHVYWKNSGDAGYPPKVVWSGAGLDPGSPPELLWPAPRRFDLPGRLVAFGYEGEVVYPVRARLAAGRGAAAHVEADVDYLVCQVDCIPFQSRLALDQPLGPAGPDPATASTVDTWWDRLPEPVSAVPGATAEVRYDPSGPALTISLQGVTAGPGADIFLEPQELFDVARPEIRPAPGGVAFRLPLTRQQVNRPLPATAPFAWTAIGLSSPRGPLALAGRSDVALVPPPPAEGPTRFLAAPVEGPTQFSKRGLATDLGAALLAGLLLALAPAPLALALSLAGALGTGAGRRVAGPAWAAGLACGAWGATVAARAGAFPGWPGWGAALGNPAWTAGLAALALLAALDLWGLLARPAAPPTAPAAARRAFLAGLAAPLLALSWPLPAALRVDLSALSFFAAYVAATAVALGLAAAGLALAALVARAQGDRAELSATSAATSAALREGLGFLAAAALFWLLYRLSREARPEGIAAIELALLAAALLAWVRRPLRPGALRRALAAVLLACALAAPFLAAGSGIPGSR